MSCRCIDSNFTLTQSPCPLSMGNPIQSLQVLNKYLFSEQTARPHQMGPSGLCKGPGAAAAAQNICEAAPAHAGDCIGPSTWPFEIYPHRDFHATLEGPTSPSPEARGPAPLHPKPGPSDVSASTPSSPLCHLFPCQVWAFPSPPSNKPSTVSAGVEGVASDWKLSGPRILQMGLICLPRGEMTQQRWAPGFS